VLRLKLSGGRQFGASKPARIPGNKTITVNLKGRKRMAIYQYYLAVVPKEGIEKKHGSIPNVARVSTETGYFKSDAAIYWKAIEVKADDIVTEMDLIVNRAKWGNERTSFNWKTYTHEIDNDASMYLDEESLTIRELSFRADLRENDFLFLKKMIALGVSNGWLFFDRKGKLMEPDFEEIKTSIRDSDAYRFLEDPIKFIENITKQNK
jgi:hypothetical protein